MAVAADVQLDRSANRHQISGTSENTRWNPASPRMLDADCQLLRNNKVHRRKLNWAEVIRAGRASSRRPPSGSLGKSRNSRMSMSEISFHYESGFAPDTLCRLSHNRWSPCNSELSHLFVCLACSMIAEWFVTKGRITRQVRNWKYFIEPERRLSSQTFWSSRDNLFRHLFRHLFPLDSTLRYSPPRFLTFISLKHRFDLTIILTLQKSTVHAWLFNNAALATESSPKREINSEAFIGEFTINCSELYNFPAVFRALSYLENVFRYRKHVYDLPIQPVHTKKLYTIYINSRCFQQATVPPKCMPNEVKVFRAKQEGCS